jgi:hypothetical protein
VISSRNGNGPGILEPFLQEEGRYSSLVRGYNASPDQSAPSYCGALPAQSALLISRRTPAVKAESSFVSFQGTNQYPRVLAIESLVYGAFTTVVLENGTAPVCQPGTSVTCNPWYGANVATGGHSLLCALYHPSGRETDSVPHNRAGAHEVGSANCLVKPPSRRWRPESSPGLASSGG